MKKKTKIIHGVTNVDPLTGAVTTPIYQTSTFKQEAVGVYKGYEYSRTKNPTRTVLEDTIANLEGGTHGFAFSSGMAAITTVFALFKAGDHIILTDDLYGGTFRLVTKVLSKFGLDYSFVKSTNSKYIEEAITDKTVAIYTETPTNPLLNIIDLEAVGKIAKAHNKTFIVDNTFLSPYFQNPINFGADIVLHSATKYIGGHSDVVAGLAVVNDDALAESLAFFQNSIGAVLGPQDSYLLLRGMKTLALRMEAHNTSAYEIAVFLENHDLVDKVYYPGLKSHPNHILAKKQATGFGGMVSFELNESINIDNFLAQFQLFTLAESLGAVESLISVPAKMTHASIPKERRAEIGISEQLIRLSIGIEDVQDLINDLQAGFNTI